WRSDVCSSDLAGGAAAVLLLKAALDDVAGPAGRLPASPRAAHAVAHQPPGRAAGQLPGAEIVLILPPDPAHIGFPCKFHTYLLFDRILQPAAACQGGFPRSPLFPSAP